MIANLLLLIAELWLLGGIALALHRLSPRLGLAPLMVYVGGMAGMLQLTSALGITVEIAPDTRIFVSSNILVPVILLSILVIYVVNGTAPARLGIYGTLGASLLGVALMLGYDLHLALPSGGSVLSSTETSFLEPSFRVITASTLAFIADLYVIAFVYQLLINRRAPDWLAVGLAMLASFWADALIFQGLASLGSANLFDRLPDQIIGKTGAALLLLPLASLYLNRLAPKVAGSDITPLRPPLDLLFGTFRQNSQALTRPEVEERRFSSNFTALQATALDIAASQDLPALLHTIVERATQLLEAPSGGLYLSDPARQTVRCVVSFNTEHDHTGIELGYGEGAAGKVAQTGKPLLIDDYPSWSGRAEFFEKGQPFSSVASAPMIWRDQVIGVIHVLHSNKSARFDSQDLELLTIFADHAAIAVGTSRLLEAEREQRDQAETLREVANALSASLDHDKVLPLILEQLFRVVPYQSASIMLVSNGDLKIVAQRGLRPSILTQFSVLHMDELHYVQQVIEKRRPVIVPDTSTSPNWIFIPNSEYIQCWMGVPLISEEQAIGLISLDMDKPGFYSEEDASLALAFAHHASIAIQNARLFRESKRRADEQTGLYETALATNSARDTQMLLERLYAQVKRLMSPDSFGVFLYDDERQELEVLLAVEDDKHISNAIGQRKPLQEGGFTGWVLRNWQPLLVRDVRSGELPVRPEHVTKPANSWLGVPLIAHNYLQGAISVQSFQPNAFDESDLRFLEALAAQVAIAFENIGLIESERKRADELATLLEASRAISSHIDLEQVLSETARQMTLALDGTSCTISLLNEENHHLSVVSAYYGPEAKERERRSNRGETTHLSPSDRTNLRTSKATLVHVTNPQSNPHLVEKLKTYGGQTLLIYPLTVQDRFIGALELWDSRQERAFSDEEIELGETIVNQASFAIENARLFEEVQTLAITDGLTKLANRRAFDRALESEMVRAQRYNHPLSLVFLDIDDFKIFNDTYGHPPGDKRLQAIAEILDQNVRHPDMAARYGGEEFALVLPHTEKEGATILAERIRGLAAQTAPDPPPPGTPVSGYTLSFGIATFPEDAQTAEELLLAADSAELAAKRAGKNRISIARSKS